MVVLAIMALVLALAVPAFRAVMPGMALEASARTVAASFREAHARAVGGNGEIAVTIDVERGLVRIGEDGPPAELGKGLGIRLVTATNEIVDRGTGRILFFPDGSATGGGVRLSAGERRIDILVDWITGRAHVVE